MARIHHVADTLHVLKHDRRVWLTVDEIYKELEKLYAKRTIEEGPIIAKRSLLRHLVHEWLFSSPPHKMTVSITLGDLVMHGLVDERLRSSAADDTLEIYEYSITVLGRCYDPHRGANAGQRNLGLPNPCPEAVEPA